MSVFTGASPLLFVCAALTLISIGLTLALIHSRRSIGTQISRNERLSEELAESRREYDQFVYIVSHDLQEPVRAVESFSQLITRRHADELGVELSELLNFVLQGAEKLRHLISALLDCSRIGTASLERRALDLSTMLDDITTRQQWTGLIPRIDYSESPLPKVVADECQIRKLFEHLLDNAVQFRDADRTLQVQLCGSRVSDECHFTVSDNGTGIPEADREAVFEPFRRLRRSDDNGTGMGLTICRQIVKRHGGRIWITDSALSGASVHFTLPAAD